jgi:predicted small lipoprotein YifL
VKLALLGLCAVLALAACGKKGNPLPPLVRVPAPPADFSVTSIHDDVFVRLTTPAANVDGVRPADVARVEVYAITLDVPAPRVSALDPEALRRAATLVASEPVRRPVAPPPPVKEGLPPIPLPPPPPGTDQGAPLEIRESLAPQTRVPATIPQLEPRVATTVEEVPRALVAPPGGGLQRYYFAAAVSARGRYSAHTALVPAPLGTTSGPPSEPRVTFTEREMRLEWLPPVDARGLGLASDPDWLPATPVVPGPPPTTYDVYEVAADTPRPAPSDRPLTDAPIGATAFSQDGITLGTQRCFYVRAVDIVNGIHVRGPASPVGCASFADTFAPPPPRELVAVAVPGGVNLIWEPAEAPDLAGYVVLRGEAGGATLTPLMTDPVTTPSYRDHTTTAGVRYVYAVVAVDRAGNRSVESNRVEETAQ